MCTFIEGYLQNPSMAVSSAVKEAGSLLWADSIDDELIYEQISTPQFRLYEELLDFSYLCTYDRYDDDDHYSLRSASDSSADLSCGGFGFCQKGKDRYGRDDGSSQGADDF